MENEQIYKYMNMSVKYIFIPSEKQSKYLIVAFSAFSPRNAPPAYNYIKTLETIDCNKLFILDDFGSRGSYYLSLGQGYEIEESVTKLIESTLIDNKIHKSNVITVGSSKGGFTALYYAIKYNYGVAISGSPQVFILDYLKSMKVNDVIDFFSDKITNDDLNNRLISTIKNTKHFPKLFIHVGKNESHYYEHVKPMLTELNVKKIKYNLNLGDYDNHNDVKQYFPEYMKNTLSMILGLTWIKNISTKKKKDIYIIKVKASRIFLKYAWYVIKDGVTIEKHSYSPVNLFRWKPKESGCYKIMVFVQDNLNNTITKTTDTIIIT